MVDPVECQREAVNHGAAVALPGVIFPALVPANPSAPLTLIKITPQMHGRSKTPRDPWIDSISRRPDLAPALLRGGRQDLLWRSQRPKLPSQSDGHTRRTISRCETKRVAVRVLTPACQIPRSCRWLRPRDPVNPVEVIAEAGGFALSDVEKNPVC